MRKLKKVTPKTSHKASQKISPKVHKVLIKNRRKKKIIILKPQKVVAIDIPVITISPPIVKIPRKRRTKSESRMYFTQDTEDAIVAYNKEEDMDIRNHIFQEKIYQPFQKLVENIFNTFKFSYFKTGPQDVQKECLTHLVANMHKFDPTRKSKIHPNKKTAAYSYFSIIAKHYLILLNNTNYREFNQNIEISEERDENTIQLQQDDKYYAQQEINDFIRIIIEFWEKNINKIFLKQRDLNIANAVVELFRNSKNIAMFNKKALYLYIRDMTDCRTQQITKVINIMKQHQVKINKSYQEVGDFNTDR